MPLIPRAQEILLACGHRPQPTMVSLDEPEHARLRKPTARAFSARRINAMIPAITAAAARLLDAVAGEPEFDLAAALAFPGFRPMSCSRSWVCQNATTPSSSSGAGTGPRCAGDVPPPRTSPSASCIAAYRSYLGDLVHARVSWPAGMT